MQAGVLVALVVFGFAFTLLSNTLPASAATGINHQINFQGKLVNPDGTNVTDGTYSIIFSLYTVSSAGSNIWTETDSVTTVAGIFQVNLGAVCPFNTANACNGSTIVDFNVDNLYLGVKVGADAEMTPRVQFTAVPQAFNSEKLGGLDKTGFIQNQTATTQTADFKINGTGNIGTSLTTPILQSAAATALTITGNAASTWSTSAGNITLQAGGGSILLGTTTAVQSTNGLAITGGTTLALASTSTNAITLDSGTTGAIGIGNTNANAKTITIGNVTGATQIVLNTGTGGVLVNEAAGSALAVTSNAVVPTVDQVTINNTGSTGVTAAGVDGLSINYKGGAAAVESEAQLINLQPGGTTGGTWTGVRVIQNVTGPATGVTSNGVKLEGPATTGGAGTYNAINIANIGTVASGGIVRGLNISGTNSQAAGTVRGIQLNNLTAGAASEIGIDLGTGWDSLVTYNNNAKTIINGTGFVIPISGGTGIDTSGSTGVPSISAGTWSVSATLAATLGGTGQSSYAVGDLLIGAAGNTLTKYADVGLGSCLVSGGVGAAPTWGSCGTGSIVQAPASTAINTISPTVASVVGLTVNGTSSTAATALIVNQVGAADGIDLNLTNTAGTQVSGLAVTRNGAGGTTTNLLNLTNTAGTVTNAINLGGTYTNLINATNFVVTNGGAITSGLINGQTISSAANFTGTLAVSGTSTLASINSSGTVNLSASTDGLMHFSGGASDGTANLYTDIGGTQKIRLNRNGSVSAVSLTLNGAGNVLSSPTTFSVDTSGNTYAAGNINAATGYQIGGAAATGSYLRGNGTNFVSSAIQAADIPTGSGNYIQNQTGSPQTAGFSISGNGTVTGSLTVNGTTSQYGAVQHYNFSNVIAGTAGWFKLGTLSLPQNGYNANISMYGGTGYNAQDAQTASATVQIRTSNGGSTNASGFAASAILTQYGNGAAFTSVKLVSNAAGTAATSYDVYVNTATFIGVGYYTVDTYGGSWINSMITAADPGANSTTVYAASNAFSVGSSVGIGTTAPGAKLDVQGGNINTSGSYLVGGSTTNGAIFSGAAGYMNIRTGSTSLNIDNNGGTANLITIQNGGNVGIGSTSPNQRLTIQDAGNINQYNGTFSVFANNLTQGVGIGYMGIQAVGSNTNQDLSLNAKGTGNISLQVSGTTGNVGIGNATPVAKLTIGGGSSNTQGIVVQSSDVSLIMTEDSSTNAGKIQVKSGGTSSAIGATNYRLALQPEGGTVGVGNSNGTYAFDVTGDINTSANLRSGNTIRLDASGNLSNIGTYNGSGAMTLSGGAQALTFNGATSNYINYSQTGVGAPTFSTRSVGTKLVLYDQVGAGAADYGFGIEGSTLWSSVPATAQQFKWYGGTTQAALLTGSGNLTLGTGAGTLTSGLINGQTISSAANFTGTVALGGSGTGDLLTVNTSNTASTSGGILLQSTSAGSAYLRYDRQGSWAGKTYLGNNASGVGDTPTTALTIDGTSGTNRVGIGSSSPGQLLDVQGGNIQASGQLISQITTGTAPLVVSSTTQVANLNASYLGGYAENQIASNLRSNENISGGGTVTYNSGISWSSRFIVISNGNGSDFSTNGYFDINEPVNTTVITGVGGHANATVAGGYVPMSGWDALYYILPIGSGNTSLNANFRIATYTSALQVPSNWVLVAVLNGDNNTLKTPIGSLTAGTSLTQGGIGGGSGNYIQNQTASAQAASFNIGGTGTIQTTSNSLNAFQVQNSASTSVLNVNTIASIVSAQGINSDATIGAELLSGNCTGTNWAGTGAGPYVHTAGNGTSLTCTLSGGVTAGATYQVTYTLSGMQANATEFITPYVGAKYGVYTYANGTSITEMITATNTSSPTFSISTTSSTVTITGISYKLVTASNSVLRVKNSSGVNGLEVRASNTPANNTLIGLSAGQSVTTGAYNTALGSSALQSTTTGGYNTAIGTIALQNNTTGYYNTAVGEEALNYNTTGTSNASLGYESLQYNVSGSNNSALGYLALRNNDAGSNNTAIGYAALFNDYEGTGNVAIGYQSGTNFANINNTFIGSNSNAADYLTNASAIGANAYAGASNSLVLGSINGTNGATASTNIGIGTTSPAALLNVVNASSTDSLVVTSTGTGAALNVQTTIANVASLGTATTESSMHTNLPAVATVALDSTHVVALNSDSYTTTAYGAFTINARVGTRSPGGTSISYGTQAAVVSDGGVATIDTNNGVWYGSAGPLNKVNSISATALNSTQFILTFQLADYNNSSAVYYGGLYVQLCTVSSGTVSCGSAVQPTGASYSGAIGTAHTYPYLSTATLSSSSFVFSYIDVAGSSGAGIGKSIVGTISGSTITLGTPTNFNAATNSTSDLQVTATDSTHFINAFDDNGATAGSIIAASVSGTTPTFGTKVTFYSGSLPNLPRIADLSSGTAILSYFNASAWPAAAVASISGTTLTVGATLTNYVTGSSGTYSNSVVALSSSLAVVTSSFINGTGALYTKQLSISGTTVTAIGSTTSIGPVNDPYIASTAFDGSSVFVLYENYSSTTNVSSIIQNFGTGTFTGDALKVVNGGNIYATGNLCIGNTTCTHALGVTGQGYASGGFSTGTPDIAEYITASEDVHPYDVVSADKNGQEHVVKSSVGYDSTAIGVIADGTSGFTMTNAHFGEAFDGNKQETDPNAKPMTLAGRIPVHVTNENGAILPGDYLTTSATIPGYAMKATHAGATIGKALASFDMSTGTVLTLINLSYYDPSDGNHIQAQTVSTDTLQTTGDLGVGGNASVAGNLNVGGIAHIGTLDVAGSADITANLHIGGDLAVTGTATIANLTVTGSTSVYDITVGGHIITAGTAPALAVQPAAGTSATVGIDGNDTAGTITITTGGKVTTTDSQGHTVVSGSDPVAGDMATINFSKVFGRTPRILLTPHDGKSAPLLIYPTGQSASGFSFSFSNLPAATTSYSFDYFIVE